MKKNPYAAIKSQYSSFSKVSKKIADFILDDPTHVTEISVQQAARELDIAESSIVRFCKLVGCSGFTEMKLLLAKYASKAVHTIFEDLSENDTVESITKNVFSRNIDTLDRAASILSQASCILIAGVGASGTIAEDFYIRLMRIGMRAESLTDSHLMQIRAGQCDASTVMIGISHTGKTHEIVSALATAREYGAKTIGITGYPHTPLKRSSDICLELYSPEQLFVSPRVAQFSLIDSLYVSIAIRQKDRVVQNIHRMNEVLEPFRMD